MTTAKQTQVREEVDNRARARGKAAKASAGKGCRGRGKGQLPAAMQPPLAQAAAPAEGAALELAVRQPTGPMTEPAAGPGRPATAEAEHISARAGVKQKLLSRKNAVRSRKKRGQ